MATEYVPLRIAAKMLGSHTIYKWRHDGRVPMNDRGECPLDYVQRLARFSRVGKTTAEHAYLCMLEWQSLHAPEHRDAITSIVMDLLANDSVFTTQHVAERIRYERRNIAEWARRDFLLACWCA